MAVVHAIVGFRPCFMLIASSLLCGCNAFVPETNYLVDCGSPNDTVVGNRVFKADFYSFSNLNIPNSIFASTQAYYVSSFDSSSLYQTARIFLGPFAYSFPVIASRRYFLRLYFFPLDLSTEGYELSLARFTVSTPEFVLLPNFQAPNSSAAVVKEFCLNVTTGYLNLTFTPLDNSPLAFVNAIELILVPDDLIAGNARALNLPQTTYDGLSNELLETVYRINGGGLKVFPDQDALWRTWIPDEKFLLNRDLAKNINSTNTVEYVHGGVTKEIAPDLVYSTGTELDAWNTSLPLLKMAWEFNVDASSLLMIRLHFCDIVSNRLNQLYFNVYIDEFLAIRDLNLSMYGLASPFYTDFVVRVTDGSGKIRVGVEPSSMGNVIPDGILNGVEIMSINNQSNNFNDHSTDIPNNGHKQQLGIVLGPVNGVLIVIILAIVFCIVLKKKKNVNSASQKS